MKITVGALTPDDRQEWETLFNMLVLSSTHDKRNPGYCLELDF